MTPYLYDPMTRRHKNPAIQDFIDTVIKPSSAWAKLTYAEQVDMNGLLTRMKSFAKSPRGVSKAVSRFYTKQLDKLGYKPIGRRE